MKKVIAVILSMVMMFLAVGASDLAYAAETPGSMEVHFIDVGQGDATLIQCGNHAMLIDAGDSTKGTAIQLYLKKQGIRKLDYLILTHPDADHIGGADVIITKLKIDTVYMSAYQKTNKTYEEVLNALEYRSMKWSTPEVGSSHQLGDAFFTVIAPGHTYSTPNNSSLGLIVTYGRNRFLFTGDAEEEAENDILKNGLNLSADVYQAGHHGSRTASGSAFLEAVNPTWAVISCGEDNKYGHPHAATLNTLRTMGVKVFRTDEQGSVIATSDGTKIQWNCAPSETWKSGEAAGSSSIRKETQVSASAEDIFRIDTNGNGRVTIKEAKEAGFIMPIHADHWLYKYMDDRDGDGMVGE